MNADAEDDLVAGLANRYHRDAEVYQRYWAPMLRPILLALLSRLPLQRMDAILDLGTGTGEALGELSMRAPAATVVGVDRSSGMLRRAALRPSSLLSVMDGRSLGFPAECFDLVLLSFSLFHFPDPPQALREVFRILRPGGRAATLTFAQRPGFAAESVWQALWQAHPQTAQASAQDFSAVNQVAATNTASKIEALMDLAGFEGLQASQETFSHHWEPEAFLALQTRFGSSGEKFQSLSSDAQQALLAQARAQLASLPRRDFLFRPQVLLAHARRPSS